MTQMTEEHLKEEQVDEYCLDRLSAEGITAVEDHITFCTVCAEQILERQRLIRRLLAR